MTLKEFDIFEEGLSKLINHANTVKSNALLLERNLHESLGLEFYDREPGFNCWTHKELNQWYSSPRDCYVSLLKHREETSETLEMVDSGI